MRAHRLYAALYDRVLDASEVRGLADRRERLLAPLRGTVVEIGAGTGLNLPHYRGLDRLVLCEPDAAMRRLLEARLHSVDLPFPVEVVTAAVGDEPLPIGAGSADAVVSTLVLCSVRRPRRALAEVRRVLRPGGALVLIEHVRGDGAGAVLQVALTPLQRAVAAGCHLDRRTRVMVAEAGFDVSGVEEWKLPGAVGPLRPAIAGVATSTGGSR